MPTVFQKFAHQLVLAVTVMVGAPRDNNVLCVPTNSARSDHQHFKLLSEELVVLSLLTVETTTIVKEKLSSRCS